MTYSQGKKVNRNKSQDVVVGLYSSDKDSKVIIVWSKN